MVNERKQGWIATRGESVTETEFDRPEIQQGGDEMIQLGVGVQGDHIQTQVSAFETLIGRPVDATRHYQDWPTTTKNAKGELVNLIVDADVLASVAAGKSPLIVWHAFYPDGTGVRWADIAAGVHDADIASVAAQLKTLGTHPARFVFHHEPEDDLDSIGAQGMCGASPAEFVGAWRRVKNHLRAAGVPKTVQIGVCLMGSTYRLGGGKNPNDWIPANSSPDFIATDGYSRDESSGQKPKSFTTTFSMAHDFALDRGKPFVIEECGVTEILADPNFKAHWYDEAATLLAQWKPSLVMYSNANAANFAGQDYRIDTSPQALAAFKALVATL